jgi:hypothetical protein
MQFVNLNHCVCVQTYIFWRRWCDTEFFIWSLIAFQIQLSWLVISLKCSRILIILRCLNTRYLLHFTRIITVFFHVECLTRVALGSHSRKGVMDFAEKIIMNTYWTKARNGRRHVMDFAENKIMNMYWTKARNGRGHVMVALGSHSGRTRVALGSHSGKGVMYFAENIIMNPVVVRIGFCRLCVIVTPKHVLLRRTVKWRTKTR